MSNDEAYSNGEFIADADAYPPRWRAEAAALRDSLGARAEMALPYGAGTREVFDLFRPEGDARGTLIFVHGGYWRAFEGRDWSGFAAGGLAAGLNVAMPTYTLAPEARISRITREIVAAVTAIAGRVEGPIHLAGHSAGGHLVARMLNADALLQTDVAARITRCVPISPLGDLRPLLDTGMNADLALTPEEAETESPALYPRVLDVPVTVWVGGAERPAFLGQARGLADAWDVPLVIDGDARTGRHHFDVIDGLRDPDSPLMRTILGGP
ncbi:N-acetylanthranilate amidase [Oceaniovalibus guishaninsula JLT2003]|uniref:N-acetylanthranilate amidase n=1 Tax=Oceaniovalibus guishaninsula JLT2003 TaxID=1231392 RepID=K2HDY3_9RHOB|nr:alpha/beta hydrolase [Oceaniovalibus guishaninsula]EKE44747.1 N-acetylanthranilate amidase [Oceaniovalibus guishaninsula JLT2003]